MARETVVVTTPGQGVGQAIGAGHSGVVCDDVEHLHAALARMRQPGRLRAMQASAHRLVADRCSIYRIAGQYVALWRGLTQDAAQGHQPGERRQVQVCAA